MYMSCNELRVEAKRKEREEIDRKVAEFVAKGGKVQVIPMGASSKDQAVPASKRERRPQLAHTTKPKETA